MGGSEIQESRKDPNKKGGRMSALLFEPIFIGKMKVKNRITMPPMATNFSDREGEVNQRLIKYYEERAKGGVGLIITESCYVHPSGSGGPTRLGFWHDKHIDGFRKLADTIHKYDVRIIAQLHHAGNLAKPSVIGEYPVSCSSHPNPAAGIIPRCLTEAEITELVALFGRAAQRAKEAGLDGIEIHAAHGYIINQFLSPLSNKRKDKYGGYLSGRITFLLEIIEKMREAVGNDYPLLVRYNGDEFTSGGLALEDSTIIARVLEKAGVHALDISAGGPMAIAPAAIPQGCIVHLAEAVKKVVRIPIGTVGRIREFGMAEEILRSKKADFIHLGRPLIADPELPKKWAEGRLKEVRRCVSCNEGCTIRMHKGLAITCTVNPMVGKEHERRPASPSKRVVVIGGGPAGMEAAAVAAMRGHKVSLFEEKEKLGGQLILAARSPFKDEINWIIEDLEHQLVEHKVSIQKGQEVTMELMEKLRPEVLIFAVGAKPLVPDIKGLEHGPTVTSHDVLADGVKTGERVVVIGGGSCGAETAEFLADQGKKVIICEMLGDVITDLEPSTRKLMLVRLSEKGIRILVNCEAKEIRPEGVMVQRNGKEEVIGADTIVFSIGLKPNREVMDLWPIKGLQNIERYEIGDCVKPRKALEAISEGAEIGEKI